MLVGNKLNGNKHRKKKIVFAEKNSIHFGWAVVFFSLVVDAVFVRCGCSCLWAVHVFPMNSRLKISSEKNNSFFSKKKDLSWHFMISFIWPHTLLFSVAFLYSFRNFLLFFYWSAVLPDFALIYPDTQLMYVCIQRRARLLNWISSQADCDIPGIWFIGQGNS